MIEINEVNTLDEVLEPEAGQVVLCDGKAYRWDPIELWQEIKADAPLASMSAYEMNKQIIRQLPNLSNKDLNEKTKLIRKFISETENKYYMLLCRELNYYTILVDEPEKAFPTDYFGDVLLECLCYWDIKAIDLAEHGGIEIWISVKDTDEIYTMYFFPYDNGVILCR